METVSADYVENMDLSDENTHLVDVLSEDHFEEKHIPGSVNIPLDQVATRALDEFDKDTEIVVYCKDEECGASPKAAEKLEKLGFEKVKDFEGGLAEWKNSGHEVES
jgi:rhodanese-related sulfurtransferase